MAFLQFLQGSIPSPTQLSLDDAEDAAFLAGDEDAAGLGHIVAAKALIDIGAIDVRPVSALGLLDDLGEEGMSVIGVARQRLGVEPKLTDCPCSGGWWW